MQILQWATRIWPGSQSLPSGLAQSHDDIRRALLDLGRSPGVERVVLLRANGSLFCGRHDEGKEAFSQSVQRLAVAGRQAARRMGLGAIEALVLEGPQGSLVLAAGHSVCGAHAGPEAEPGHILGQAEPLAGLALREVAGEGGR